jgi:phosphate transport system substrate-binding protein
VKLAHWGRAAGVAAVSVVALAACSSSSGGSSSTAVPSASGSIAGIACAAGTLNSSGSSAQANAMTQWISDYQQTCTGATVNYSPSGSGAGILDFINDQVSFAGSDAAIADPDLTNANKRCTNDSTINIPMVGGPIAVAYNVSGVDKLVLSPSVIAGIFDSTITTWNDPAIAKLNPGVKLPSATIAQFHRSDSSGTSANFTAYLTAAAPNDWSYGSSKDWSAPGGQGSNGSDQVAASVQSTANSIGYMEWSYAKNDNLGVAWVDNGSGAVELSAQSAAKTIGTAKITGTAPDLTLSIDYATQAKGAYPLVLVTYEITCNQGLAADQLALVQSFLGYTASAKGQGELAAQYYAPLPSSLITKVRSTVAGLS